MACDALITESRSISSGRAAMVAAGAGALASQRSGLARSSCLTLPSAPHRA
ncbi:hypothetical protein SCE1572_25435 [Sorangium cellulosum So0157-2]|uniref:Uncharacterized protein n=1 Tax=Sorangium cellulosum So0157-2 TaxID=1254432 RepID=S4XYY7_SORCE|nr:hypothetical protein SCE1572_25435 [Sorangium cellulosum So0157-2]